jgi:MarR family transcriptional regulator, organic hydroperoxide resistance regulator
MTMKNQGSPLKGEMTNNTVSAETLDEVQNRVENVMLSLFRPFAGISELVLSSSTLAVLSHLRDNEEVSVGRMSRKIDRSQGTTSELLSRLQKIGLVKHDRKSADGRVVTVHITNKGRDALREVGAKRTAVWDDLLNRLGRDDRKKLEDAMRQVCAMLGTENR